MDIFFNSRIRTKLFMIFLLLIITLGGATSLLIYSKMRKIITKNIESELNNATKSILNMIKIALDAAIKSHLRAATLQNKQIIQNFHTLAKRGQLSLNTAKRMAAKFLLSQKIGRTGYIYCVDSNGIIQIHPQKALLGKNLSQYNFIQSQIKEKSGYISYSWKNPNEKKNRPKALYMSWFKPWDWIISVTSYKEEFKDLIKVSDFKEKILSLTFGKSGYSYLVDKEGNIIIHPFIKGNYLNIKDSSGRQFVKEMLTKKTGRIVYDWKNPGEKKARKKLVTYNTLPETGWVIASCSYLDEFNKPLTEISNFLWLIAICAIIISAFFSALLSSYITTPLRKMIYNFKKGSEGETNLRMPVHYNDELGQLARYFNKFMEKQNELNKKEEQLRQAQKMEVVGTLAGGLAHDFNNILAAIMGNASLIRNTIDNKEPIFAQVKAIEKASKRAAAMVQQLLTLSRKNELTPEVVDLNNAINDVIQICKSSFDKKITITTELPKEPALVLIDPAGIEQILLNLCINAYHAMTIMHDNQKEHGGTLSLSLTAHRPAGKNKKKYWQIAIRDTGTGIDEEHLSKIFDPFFTTKDKSIGTGLGLSMAYNILNRFNGKITAESQKKKGSTFKISLPAIEKAKASQQKTASTTKLGQGTILIIDDEEIIRNIASEILKSCGYTTTTADSGYKGVTIFKKKHQKISAVLLDMIMPGISGRDTFHQLREINKDVPIIISSGFKQDERVQEVLQEPNTNFLPKPYDMSTLSNTVYKILHQE